jgi:Protein of unknown function (DUF3326)
MTSRPDVELRHVLLLQQRIEIPTVRPGASLLTHLSRALRERLDEKLFPVRFAITHSDSSTYHCEIGVLRGIYETRDLKPESVFQFSHRGIESTDQFNLVLVVPTGIGAEIGGHAGDATPVVRMLAVLCDNLITHPNVLNASDINEMPNNALYVEGSVLSRLLMGTVGLGRVRSNRVLTVVDAHQDQEFVSAAINSVNAARAAYGLQCSRVVQLDPPIKLLSGYTASGTAGGRVEALAGLFKVLDEYRDEYDAVALSSVIGVPASFHLDYFLSEGSMVNPWGGVEAMLTHAVSTLYNVPSAHSPMPESREIAHMDTGVVDPRMAAEAVSETFLNCILKGLQRSPQIVTDIVSMSHRSIITARDISCLVIPDGCLGLPTLAALEQGIKVIAVRENRNIMRNDLKSLPWAEGQLHIVDNYWEAAGVVAAIKAGLAPQSVRRPMTAATVEIRVAEDVTDARTAKEVPSISNV